ALAAHFEMQAARIHLIIGMLANKDPASIIAPLRHQLASITVGPVPGHECHTPEALAKHAQGIAVREAANAADALANLRLQAGDIVLIAGSLYLAGTVLSANGDVPA
ncbi:MAG: bifunctional folylpolyglutamate synthase/dihydrofolate synthase, partial [Sphingorhabdus sp.]|nr:bifunctional folylpolyglutamate synthase/dihydrofolate synthase [Sphingorhabdus sp.]